ncbi:MAG: ATP-binding cassette domain-containing protein [Fervidobacterium sp.]
MRKKDQTGKISEIICENFSAKVGENVLFENINARFIPGEITILYGPRGSGKSAFLRSIVNLNKEIYPGIEYSGKLLLDGKTTAEIDEKSLRQAITYLDTNFLESLDYLTLKELINLTFGKNFDFTVEKYATALDDFGVLKALYKFEKTPLSSLYVLEKIGLLLFISTLKQSSVLVFDCLIDHLDDEHIEFVTKLLNDLSSERTIILSTRTLKRFLGLGSVLLTMKSGKIIYSGKPENFILGVSQ